VTVYHFKVLIKITIIGDQEIICGLSNFIISGDRPYIGKLFKSLG